MPPLWPRRMEKYVNTRNRVKTARSQAVTARFSHRSQTGWVWLTSRNPPRSNMPVIDRPWAARRKNIFPAISSYPTRERTFLSLDELSRNLYLPTSSHARTFAPRHIKRRPPPLLHKEGTSVLLNVICCRVPSSHFSNWRRRRSLKSRVYRVSSYVEKKKKKKIPSPPV